MVQTSLSSPAKNGQPLAALPWQGNAAQAPFGVAQNNCGQAIRNCPHKKIKSANDRVLARSRQVDNESRCGDNGLWMPFLRHVTNVPAGQSWSFADRALQTNSKVKFRQLAVLHPMRCGHTDSAKANGTWTGNSCIRQMHLVLDRVLQLEEQ
jgi:hypothetical protein